MVGLDTPGPASAAGVLSAEGSTNQNNFTTDIVGQNGGSPNPLLDAALNYARRGWHVLPLNPQEEVS